MATKVKVKKCPWCYKPLHQHKYGWSHLWNIADIMSGKKICDYSEKT